MNSMKTMFLFRSKYFSLPRELMKMKNREYMSSAVLLCILIADYGSPMPEEFRSNRSYDPY